MKKFWNKNKYIIITIVWFTLMFMIATNIPAQTVGTTKTESYKASFEKDVLKKLAIAFPEDKEFLDGLINRFVDLLVPFRKAWYYKPEMGKSASIKSVLPAIAPEFSYKDLKISNGGLASNTFLSMILNKFEGDEAEARENLLAQCERDTLGMVVIWKHLMEL